MTDGEAPYLSDLADGPRGGFARWLTASDGVRLRAAFWPLEDARGTVCILPGRTEYAEKYGRTAAGLAARGYASLAIDWRGQGLADRLLPDPRIGHVRRFAEYQRDLDAVMAVLDRFAMPAPRFMLAHSMGGCIGLRALVRGLPFRAAALSAPMLGIPLPNGRPGLTRLLVRAGTYLGMAGRYAPPPATGAECYVAEAPFEGNVLTTDRETFDWMKGHLRSHPELMLGGPSLRWLLAALDECRALAALPSPDIPAVAMLGTAEKVVDPAAIRERMARWPSGRLEEVPGAEHEILMDTPANRARFLDAAAALFAAQG